MVRLVSYCIPLALILTSCVYHDLTPQSHTVPMVRCDTISWQRHILPIMEQNCAIKGCHDGKTRLDWRDYETIKDFAASVEITTLDHSMPPDFSISDKEIQSIRCWVDGGAPEN